jgi:disulfide bond formation protein DsbB
MAVANPHPEVSAKSACATAASVWTWAALVVAVAGLSGSLFLSMGMQLQACPLCFYQRTFVMSLVAVLALGLLTRVGSRLSFLALPLATAGLGVALFHVSLEVRGKLECPKGVLGLGTSPQQSMAIYVLLFGLLLVDLLKNSRCARGFGIFVGGGLIVGILLAVASLTSNPPMKGPPKTAYPNPQPEICRPPYQPQ